MNKTLFAFATATLLGLMACGKQSAPSSDASSSSSESKPAAGKKLTVGFSQVGAESDWRVAESKSIKDEAAKRGVDLKFSDAQGKQENQIAAIRAFIAQGADGIILAPKVETGWDQVLKEARTAKIPVVLVDRGIDVKDDSLYATLIASDFVAEGKMAADWLAKKMNGKANIAKKMNGKANIIELEGTPGSAPANDRKKGFAEGIKAHPDMKIIAAQSADFETGKGKEVMETLLQQHGNNVNAVYAHNDNMALGAIEAIKAAGKKPGIDITIVSIDGVKSAFEAMVKGELNCTVECNPLLGTMAFDALDKAIKGEQLPKKTVVQDKVYDQTVAKEVIGSRQY
jgi:galactofuranose transport system substrate-binding protein